jgi:alkylation response protein AidB-like acyl-CoA dehydrogenase
VSVLPDCAAVAGGGATAGARYDGRVTSRFIHGLAAGTQTIRIRSASDLRASRAAEEGAHTVDQAALAGLIADGMGWAFAAGYEAALVRLDPEGMRGGVLGSLCATEEGGGHPRAIRTSLAPRDGGFALSGQKSYVTLGDAADVLLVVASVGDDSEGRNRLRVARVPSRRRGVTVSEAPASPFVPEIAHAKATFEDVAIHPHEILPGDGYGDALKPFRTIEDVHVMVAILGWAIGVGRASHWPRSWLDEALALVVTFRAVSDEPPLAPETHIALAGAQSLARRLLGEAAWSQCEEATAARWERDRPLLEVAKGVRGARLEAAWRAMAGQAPRRGD